MPYCSNQSVLSGYNNLITTHLEIAAQCHPIKNGDSLPNSVVAGSGKKVWWRCSVCGYSWQTAISARGKGKGCEQCYKRNNSLLQQKRAVLKKGAFALTHPHLIEDWDYSKNEGTPNDYSAGSRYRANWKCHHCGYEWASSIFKRTGGHKCPKCHK